MIYIDDASIPFQRMIMCHMIADTSQELKDMAVALGLNLKWIQYHGTYREHFDVCKKYRAVAIELGAKPVTQKELARIVYSRRPNAKKEN